MSEEDKHEDENTDKKNETEKKETLSPKEAVIQAKASQLETQYGEGFDKDAFTIAAKAYIQEHGTLDGMSTEEFINENKKEPDNGKDKDQLNDGDKLAFGLERTDGKITARGTDGTIFEGKNFEEVNDKVCDYMKKQALAEGKEPKIGFTGKDPEEQKTFSKNAIMKHNVTILAGWPEDKQFWQDLKKEYLADKSHKLEDWEKMTRKVPDDIMQRTPEEKDRNKKLNDKEVIEMMRRGQNPKLQQQSGPTPPTDENSNSAAPTTTNKEQSSNEVTGNGENEEQAPKDGKAKDADLISKMRRGFNPNVAETIPPEKNKQPNGRQLSNDELNVIKNNKQTTK